MGEGPGAAAMLCVAKELEMPAAGVSLRLMFGMLAMADDGDSEPWETESQELGWEEILM